MLLQSDLLPFLYTDAMSAIFRGLSCKHLLSIIFKNSRATLGGVCWTSSVRHWWTWTCIPQSSSWFHTNFSIVLVLFVQFSYVLNDPNSIPSSSSNSMFLPYWLFHLFVICSLVLFQYSPYCNHVTTTLPWNKHVLVKEILFPTVSQNFFTFIFPCLFSTLLIFYICYIWNKRCDY